jgi:hypothetical protein
MTIQHTATDFGSIADLVHVSFMRNQQKRRPTGRHFHCFNNSDDQARLRRRVKPATRQANAQQGEGGGFGDLINVE